MNAVERTHAALSGQTCERPPVIPLVIQHALHVAGVPHSAYSTDPAQLAGAQLFAWKTYGYDGFHISSDNYVVSEAMGNAVRFPFDEPPQKVFGVLEAAPDLTRLRDVDPLADGRMPVLVGATRIARQEAGGRTFIKANCDSGPLSVASSLRGAENLFVDILDGAPYVPDLLELTSRAIVRYARALADAGAHAITYGESTASLVGRDVFESLVLPYNRYVVGEIKKTGLPVFYHMCGNVDHIVDLLPLTGADALELDSFTDLPRAYDLTRRSICIEGTVDTVKVLLQGSPDDVRAAAKACVEASRNRYLILSSGCEVPRLTPPCNLRALMDC